MRYSLTWNIWFGLLPTGYYRPRPGVRKGKSFVHMGDLVALVDLLRVPTVASELDWTQSNGSFSEQKEDCESDVMLVEEKENHWLEVGIMKIIDDHLLHSSF